MIENFEQVQALAESWSAGDLLRWSFAQFHPKAVMVSGFGADGVALIDIAAGVVPELHVVTVDTGFLFPETGALIERIERRYGIKVERVRPTLSPEQQAQLYGEALWTRDPDLCCRIRKVEALRQGLTGLRAWITAIRREQTAVRATARKLEWDEQFGLLKVNPIVDWTTEQVWRHIRQNNVPYNPLHDRNYTSIGCTHCTRPVQPGEGPRAGRWAGFAKTECGLHGPDQPGKAPVLELVQLDTRPPA